MELKAIEKRLPIDKHHLDEELEIQAQLQYFISSKAAELSEELSSAKESLKLVEAGLVKEFAQRDTKMTVKQLDSAVQLSEAFLVASEEVRDIQKELDKAHGLLDAWRQKGFALKALADLSMTNYYAIDSTSVRKEQIKEVRNSRTRLNPRGRNV